MARMLIPEDPYTVHYMEGCPYSEAAVGLLEARGINYNKVVRTMDQLKTQYGEKATFPRIYDRDGDLIGGYDDLSKMLSNKNDH